MRRRATLWGAWIVAVVGCGPPAPVFEQPQTLGGVEVDAATLTRGAAKYWSRCASCHGYEGAGDGPAGRGLQRKPRDFSIADFEYTSTGEGELPTDEDMDEVIRNGRVKHGMPGFPGMSPEDRHAVVQFIKTFSPKWRGTGDS